MRYAGGKGACYPHLINLMPPHRRYIETHLGGGAVMRSKKPAEQQVGIDLDATVVANWKLRWPSVCELIQADALEVLNNCRVDSQTLVYSDPPYHPETRRRERVYRCDYTVGDHERLLDCLTALPCKVMLSGYPSGLYERRLSGWSVHRFWSKTHTGMREEWVWFNYPKPSVLHDDRFLGADFRERELIRRRQDRLRRRIGELSIEEQASLHGWLAQTLKTGDAA